MEPKEAGRRGTNPGRQSRMSRAGRSRTGWMASHPVVRMRMLIQIVTSSASSKIPIHDSNGGTVAARVRLITIHRKGSE